MSKFNSSSEAKASTKSKILFQLSGSIACFKACAVLSKLAQAGHEIEVVATASALKFVGEATLEGLTGRKVHKDTFETGGHMDHIHLIRSADLIVLCPATANTLNKFAAGLGDDLISTMFLAHDFRKPYLIAPAMNQFMWSHPATQASVAKLQSWGLNILGTSAGALACGEIGEGRMQEPEQILSAIELALTKGVQASAPAPKSTAVETSKELYNSAFLSEIAGKKILITSGGTSEPIDGVRAITNTSSGRTGAQLATWFANRGNQVTLLHAQSASLPAPELKLNRRSFSSFNDLQNQLSALLKSEAFDLVIHLAAVADYSVAEVESNGAVYEAPLKEKIDSGEELTLRLKKNPKLVDSIRSLSKNKNVKVVAFKLTSTENEETRLIAVTALAEHSSADFIVQNDATQISATSHPFRIFRSSTAPMAASPKSLRAHEMNAVNMVANVDGAAALAEKLNDLLHSQQKPINEASSLGSTV